MAAHSARACSGVNLHFQQVCLEVQLLLLHHAHVHATLQTGLPFLSPARMSACI